MKNEIIPNITATVTVTVVEIQTVTATVTGVHFGWELFAKIVGVLLAVAGVSLTLFAGWGATVAFTWYKNINKEYQNINKELAEVKKMTAEKSEAATKDSSKEEDQ